MTRDHIPCVSLRHFQTKPERVPAYAGQRVRIWSEEHKAYWRCGGAGYTSVRREAGTWVFQDAAHNLRHLGPEKQIWFEIVRPGDTGPEAKHLRHYHEDLGPVLWWAFPIAEAPWVGRPHDSDWPGYHTHFTPLPDVPHKPRRGSRFA